jgi:membrane-associated phospholipid phosphatase
VRDGLIAGMAPLSDPTRRHGRDAAAFAVGLGLTALAGTVADRHPSADRRVFAALNDREPGPVVPRLLQQLGTPWVLPATSLVAAATGRRHLALAAAAALPVEKAFEVGIKKLRPTPRPLHVEPTALRDDAPVEGESFPSGHAAIAFTAAGLVAPHLSTREAAVAYVLAAAASLVRVSQGAHHPLDSVAGAALGLGLAGGLHYAVGRDPR